MRRFLGTAWHPDMAATMRDVLVAARRRHGYPGVAIAVIAELFDLVRAAVRALVGAPPKITGGWSPNHSDQPGRSHMQTLMHDLKLAVRSLAASRVPAGIAIVTLALGIGVSAAIFSALDSILIRPLPFQHSDRLVEIWNFNLESKFSYPRMPRALFLEWQKQQDLFDRVEGYEVDSAIFAAPAGAEMISAAYVTPGLMPLLGVAPQQGRLLVDGDGRDGTDDRVVVSDRFWRKTLQQDPAALGRRITLHGRPHEIVGIMPPSFRFPYDGQDLWLPLDPAHLPAHRSKGRLSLTAFARTKSGVTVNQVGEQVTARGVDLVTATGGRPGVTATLNIKGQAVDTKTRQSLLVMAAAVGFLLLIVCANIANLSLSRALARSRDLAVRASLGASRVDLIRETFVENLLIGGLGAVLGIGVAAVTLAIGASALPTQITFSMVNTVDLDGRVLLFAVSVGLLASVLFGLPPALMASRPNVNAVLRQDTRTSAGSRGARRLRSVLVIGEVMVAIVLLVGAALMGRAFYELQAQERGFNTTGLISLKLGLPAAGFLDPHYRDQFTDNLIARLRQLPGVTATSAGGVPPDSNMLTWGKVEFDHSPGVATPKELFFPIYTVFPGYFEAVGLPIKEGRAFDASDASDKVIISETFARDYWPNRSAVGAQFRFTGSTRWKTVVGVSQDVKQLDMDDSVGPYEWFEPLRTPPGRKTPAAPEATTAIIDYRTVLVRADNPAVVIPELTKAVHGTDSRAVIWETDLVDDLYAEAIERPRVVLVALAVFSLLGLVLAAAGLYGVLSHLVTQRLREIGIRLALGAHPTTVFRLILRNGLTLTAVGLVLGLGAAIALTRWMKSILYGLDSLDPLALTGVTVLLAVTALFACWRPARRAMRVDPVHLLRES